jgi:hypothetical protein
MQRYDLSIYGGVRESANGDLVMYASVVGLELQLALAKDALEQIAKSYPETEEGAVLASLARNALTEMLK